jgi:hypothetical protein
MKTLLLATTVLAALNGNAHAGTYCNSRTGQCYSTVPDNVKKIQAESQAFQDSQLNYHGRGCSYFGVKIIEAVENAAKENRNNKVNAAYFERSEKGKLKEIVHEAEKVIQKDYWERLRNVNDNQVGIDYYIPRFEGTKPKTGSVGFLGNVTFLLQGMQAMEATKFQECFPETWKTIQEYTAFLNEEAKAAAKRRAEIQAEENSPHGQVRQAYTAYIFVRWCHEIREGYMVKYVNDVEMDRAETAIRAIVQKWKVQEPNMNTDQLWQQADQRVVGKPINLDTCHYGLRTLLDMSPIPAVRVTKPE